MVYNCLKNSIQKLIEAIYPYNCALCRSRSQQFLGLCTACELALARIHHACDRCGRLLTIRHIHRPVMCGVCIQHPPAFDQTHAPLLYQEPLNWLIQALKFNHHLPNAELLASLWLKYKGDSLVTLPTTIIPVPLHPKRLQQRGFNQALEIAKPLADHLGLKVNYQSCQRVIETGIQADLPAKKRLNNMKNAFKVVREIGVDHIAIIDDVMTTGSTVNELAKVIKQSGVNRVDVWCIARTIQ